jgi:hypothetical protein
MVGPAGGDHGGAPAAGSGVDVVIPAFNPDVEQLAGAVRSALAVAGCERVVVVDDGSATPVTLAGGDAGLGARVELVRQANAGPAAARNRGIERTRAAWVLFLDADDEVMAEGVRAAIALAERLRAGAVVASRIELDERGGRVMKAVPAEWADRVLPARGDVFRPIVLFSTTGVLVHRRVIEAGVRFDEAIVYGEDRDFLHSASGVAAIVVSTEPVVVQRVFRDGGNLRSPRKLPRWIRDHVRVLEKHVPVGGTGALPSASGPGVTHRRDACATGEGDTARVWLAEQTRWLLNAASKAWVDAESWGLLTRAARARGWGVPLKCRVRRLLKRGR